MHFFVRYTARCFISGCCILAFTSADIVFHKFLELHSTLCKKKDFCHNFFFFFNGFTQTSHSLNGQNLLSVTSFLSMLANFAWVFTFLRISLTLKTDLYLTNYLQSKTCKKSHSITRTLIALNKFVFHPENCLTLFKFRLSRVNCSYSHSHFFSLVG